MDKTFEVKYAGIPIKYRFRKNSTGRYFSKHIRLSESDTYDIRMNDEEFEMFRIAHPEDVEDDYVEYKGLIYLTARKLLSDHCCIFHAVSFYWKDRAWLLTGKSGIGKTTQYMNWEKAFPEELLMISGDMPVLDFRDSRIYVHPSPWNGKEKKRSMISAELGGIIILKQDDSMKIERAEEKEAIQVLFQQFAIIPKQEEEIRSISRMVERMVREVPVWVFSNDGSEDSSRMLREALLGYLGKEDHT